MSILSTRRQILVGTAATLAARALERPSWAASKTVAVIVGRNSPVTSMSRTELRRLFLGDSIRIAGQTLVPFNAPFGLAERLLFESAVLEMNGDQITKLWIDHRIRGEGRPPKMAPTTDLQVRLTATFPGALSYVSLTFVNDAVKVVAIDGKKPGDPGYVLTG